MNDRFVELTCGPTPVLVRLGAVDYIEPRRDGATVHFGDRKDYLYVEESLEEVKKKLCETVECGSSKSVGQQVAEFMTETSVADFGSQDSVEQIAEREQLLNDLHAADYMYLYDAVSQGDLVLGAREELQSLMRAVEFRDAALAILQQHSDLLQKLDD